MRCNDLGRGPRRLNRAALARMTLSAALLAALCACKPMTGTRDAPPAMADAPVEQAPAATPPSRVALPPEACAREGAWAFFEQFVRRQDVRDVYSRIDLRAGARSGSDNFRIALVDNRWVYVDPALPDAQFSRVRLNGRRDGDRFVLEYVRARFGQDDEVLATEGATGRYVFEFRDGCWALTNAEP